MFLSFSNTIFNLQPSTQYYIRAYVVTLTDTVYGEQISINTMEALETSTVTDYEGNTYKTVKMGDKWWMADNLRSTKYSDGASIPKVINLPELSLDSPSYYFWYDSENTFYRKSISINVNTVDAKTPDSHRLYGYSVRCVKD